MEEDRQGRTLEEVQGLFETWRKERTHRRPIPEELWRAAISLTKEYSLYQITKHLRLDFKELKRRMGGTHRGDKGSTAVSFMELDVMAPAECIVEIERPDGIKMRISAKGRGSVDVIELGRAFWGSRR